MLRAFPHPTPLRSLRSLVLRLATCAALLPATACASDLVAPAPPSDLAPNEIPADLPAPAMTDMRFGAYTYGGVWQGDTPILDLEATLGRRLDIVHWYMNWQNAWDPALLQVAAASGRIPLISWQPHRPTLAQIRAGDFDAYLTSWAHGARDYGAPVYLRPFPEMNGEWTPWSGDPDGLVVTWQHVVDLFRREGADNVFWVWAPNVTDQPATDFNRLERYYPGSAYVDVLALDGFNWGTSRNWSSWRSFEEVFEHGYARVSALGPQPVWITEVACAERGGDKGAWVRDMFASTAFPRLEALVWFNENKEADWRITSSDPVLASFRQWLPAVATTSNP